MNFAQTIEITERQTLAAALEAAGYDGTHNLTLLKIMTADAVELLVTEDGLNQPGTAQVETNTVVSAGITSNGDAQSVVTAAGMSGSPVTVTVPVTTATHTSASLIATAFRTALNLDADVSAFFTIGGTGAVITLTAKTPNPNDATMNFTIEDVTSDGITDDTTSDNTTAGSLDNGITIDNDVFSIGDGSAVVIDSGLAWLIPTGTPELQIFARD